MRRTETPLKIIFRQRFSYLLEVLIIYLGIFIFLLIPNILLPYLIDWNSVIYEPIYYILRAVVLITAISIFLYLATFIMEKQRKKLILEEDISPSRNFLSLFNITKKNFKFQLLYGVLLLFLIFIPLDFFTYFFSPDMLSFMAVVVYPAGESFVNSYFMESYYVFLLSVIIIQIFVAIYEESLVRGFFTNRGSDYVNKMSAVIITSFFFGLLHFKIVLIEPSLGLPIIFPIIWFLQTFFVGIILAMVVLRKHWIFPAIFAHTLNNIISAHSIWNYINGQDFSFMTIFVYIPLLVIGIILFIWQFPRIKESLLIGFKEFKSYFARDTRIKERSSDVINRIILDFLIGLIIFLIGLVLF